MSASVGHLIIFSILMLVVAVAMMGLILAYVSLECLIRGSQRDDQLARALRTVRQIELDAAREFDKALAQHQQRVNHILNEAKKTFTESVPGREN